MIVLFLIVGLIYPSCGMQERFLVKSTIHEDIDPPVEFSQGRNPVQIDWIHMPLDHFNPQNNVTFPMRYAYNEEYFGGDGSPIFIMAGGYALSAGWLRTGNMYQMAQENRGYLVKTEYRYYGQSFPFTDFSAHNLRYLSMEQALADLAYFIGELKKQPRFANSKIILYGGSKAANMVTWFKKRYPHLVLGVVASSGPFLAKIDFTGYLEVVDEAFTLEGDEQCMAIIRQGIQDTVDAMNTVIGRRSVEQAYRLCPGTFNFNNRLDLGYFSAMITWSISGLVQYAYPGQLTSLCQNFKSQVYGNTPMEQIGGFISDYQGLGSDCWIFNYQNFVNSYRLRSDSRSWYYQMCTEFGYFQIAPHSGTVFDPLTWLDLDFYLGVCKQAYDLRFDETFAFKSANRSNLVFGGLSAEVTNTINIHGYLDPWRYLGIYKEDIQETSPTYTVPRASHCFDMRSWAPTDTLRMDEVRQRARTLVSEWLRSEK